MNVAIDAVGIRSHGAASVLQEWLRWLPVVRPDWQWHVFLLERRFRQFDNPPPDARVCIEETPRGNGWLARWVWVNWQLPQRVRRLQADVLLSFANVGSAHPPVPAVLFVHQLKALDSLHTGEHTVVQRIRLHAIRMGIRRSATSSRYVIVQTQVMRQALKTLEPGLDGKVRVIPSGFREVASPLCVRPDVRRQVEGLPRPRLVYVANIGDHKNHRLLLEALPLLLRRFPELQLMLTLEPPSPAPRGGAYERDLHRRASALGVQAHLCWLGHLSSDEVYWALQQSELSVFPSLTESFGLPLVESMVAACPIAAADRPYAHEVCGEAACYFDPENATSAFTSINEVLQDRLLRDRLVRQGAARSQQFSYRGIVEQVAETLEAAAEPVRAAPISPRGLPVMQKALFLYGNQPEALPVSMMLYLRRLGTYQVDLIYWERIGSRISVPLTARLSEVQRYPVRWPVGRSFISKLWHRIVLLLLFVKQIRALRPDIIHAWNFDMLLAARLAVATLPQSKLVFTLQDTTQWMLSRSLRSLQRWVYRKVDILFVTSEGFDTELLRRFRLIPEHTRVHFVANAPPAQFFAKFEPRKAQGDLTVGYIGFLRGRQGITTLVKAAELARQEGSPVSLLFAGTGVDQELVDAFAKKDKHIKVAGPYRYEEHILDLYRQVDVLYAVYDSSYDKKIHLAYRLCEAINCRLPIIVAKGTHMAEVTERLGVGVSVEAGDVAGLATALKNLHANESLRSRIARNCQAHRHEFVFEFYEDRILQAYKELRSHPVCKQNARARKHLIADKIPL